MTCRALSLALLLASTLTPTQVWGQAQLLGASGLGRRVLPLDARARGIGNAGVSLHGGNLSALNPAAAARFTGSGIWATFLPEARSVKGDFASGKFQTEDVPVIRLVFPFGGRWATSISAGGYLDQDWGVEFIDTLSLVAEEVPFQETRTSDGGVTQFRLELAGVIAEGWSLGGGVLFYSGQTRRRVQRAFSTESAFVPYQAFTAIDYRGWGLSLGVEYQPFAEMILGVAGTWGANLRISNDTTGQGTDVGLPLTLDVGGSWRLTPGLLFALSFGWEDWSSVANDLPAVTASDVLRVGGGFEFAALRRENTEFRVRAGAHADRQPFEVRENAVWERGINFGLGLILVGGRARIDLAFDFGKRGSIEQNDVEETFQRFSFGAGVFVR